ALAGGALLDRGGPARRPGGAGNMTTAEELWHLPRAALLERIRHGHRVEVDQVADVSFRGTSLGLPGVVDRLLWKTFRKCMVRDGDVVRGWNVRLEQTGLRGPSVPTRRNGR